MKNIPNVVFSPTVSLNDGMLDCSEIALLVILHIKRLNTLWFCAAIVTEIVLIVR